MGPWQGEGIAIDLAALRTEFLARGFNDYEASASNTRKDRLLNAAMHRICEREPWPFLITTTTGNSPLTISDLRAVLSVVDTTNRRQLDPEDIRTIREADPTLAVTGPPECWYQSAATIIGCWPTTVTALSVRYIKVAADLSLSTDSPVIPTRYHEVIVDGACAMAYRARNNVEMAEACRTAFEEGILQMSDSLLGIQYDATMGIVVSGSNDW